jgi:predicted nucleotidyltransferase
MEMARLPGSLRRVVDRYVRAFAPDRIILFGSYAKGTHQQCSDIDLVIVADLVGDASIHLRRAHQLAMDCFPPVDAMFVTTEEIERSMVDRNPFLFSILGTGITLYERGQPFVTCGSSMNDKVLQLRP